MGLRGSAMAGCSAKAVSMLWHGSAVKIPAVKTRGNAMALP